MINNIKKLSLITITITLMISEMAFAQRSSVSVEIGTFGVGFDYAIKAPFYQSSGDTLNLRFGLSANNKIGDTDIPTTKARQGNETVLSSKDHFSSTYGSFLVDWHPYNGNFRATFGLVQNTASYKTYTDAIRSDVTIGSTKLSGVTLKTVSKVSQNAINPYLGFGYGYNMKAKHGFKFNLSIGVIVQNDPEVDFTVSGDDAGNGYAQTDIDAEITKLTDNIPKTDGKSLALSLLPHVSIGLELKF